MRVPYSVHREQGSATVTALIVVGVATVLIAGLMWRQQIAVRSLENMRDRIQAQWLERAALDFARLVLAQDQRTNQYDYSGESWALPLADGKVADFLKNADVPDEIASVTLQGQLVDAQSVFNLRNLWDVRFQNVNLAGVQEYARLLDILGLDSGLAQKTAQGILDSNMLIDDVGDLVKLPTYTLAMVEQIRPYVAVLPRATTVNVNTALLEVLMAAMPGLSRSAAYGFIDRRSTAPAQSLDQIAGLLGRQDASSSREIDAALIDVKSQFWMAHIKIHLGSGLFASSALIERSPTALPNGNFTQVVWNRIGKLAAE